MLEVLQGPLHDGAPMPCADGLPSPGVVVKGSIPAMIHVPHCSTALPAVLTNGCRFSCDPVAEAELMADSGTAPMCALLAAGARCEHGDGNGSGRPDALRSMLAGASSATASVSRILVDYERFDSEAEEMAAVGMGVVYESAHDLSPLYEAAIPGSAMAARKALYRAWTDSVEAEALRILSAHGRLLFVDLHSYAVEALPYELHSDLARPPLCVGVDADDEALGAVLHAVDGHHGVALANEPFRGSYRPLSLLGDGRVSSVMLEIRKDMVDPASGRVDAAVCSAMADVLAAAASSIGIRLPCDG